MTEVQNRLKAILQWSDRIGSDEICEIHEIIALIEKNNKVYDGKDMEKAFIAGGKLSRDINNDSFDEFLSKLKR